MTEGGSLSSADTRRLVLVPALITLGITLLRLLGELMRWSERFFSRAAGGPGAVVGIVWLVPIFGIYFALRLVRTGHGPQYRGRAIAFALAGLLAVVALGFLWATLGLSPVAQIFAFSLSGIVGASVAFFGWRALGQALLTYGLAARIPVIVVMLLAILGNWGTHYELGRPDLPPLEPPLLKWFVIGVAPQLGLWVPFTMIVGAICGSIAGALVQRPRAF